MLYLLPLCFLAVAVFGQLDSNTVALDYGTFVGLPNETLGYISFMGMRFADAPIGELRWRPPVIPPSTNLGTVNATTFGPACIAAKTAGAIPSTQSEDCLYVNVYAPTGASKLLPVLVFFHGGGFEGGNSHSVTARYLIPSSNSPFLLVTFEYRVGAFGFLAGKQLSQDGTYNVGMLDQRGGLRWVQRYISAFGGDPMQVTIWGQSAGAGATMFHLISNSGDSEGLFHQAMGDSPSLSYMPDARSAYDQATFDNITSFAGCDADLAAMSCLRNASAQVLANAGNSAHNKRPHTLYIFAPRVDGSLIIEPPVEAFRGGRFAHVPVLFGGNSDEGSGWSSSLPVDANTSSPNATERTIYNFLQGQYASLTEESFNNLLGLYPLTDFASFDLQGQKMYGEARYICSPALITQNTARVGLPSYNYHYNNDHLGSEHGDEFFGPFSSSNAADNALFEKMRQYWTSFVTSGLPIAADGATWTTVTGVDGGGRIRLDPANLVMENIPEEETERCDAWHDLHSEIST